MAAELTDLEIACGLVLEDQHRHVSLPPPSPPRTARQALEEVVAAALASGPCHVSFSGGRDSSALLAVATHVARSRGAPGPIPLTLRYVGVPEADESAWQEMVIDHLDLRGSWQVVTLRHEHDLLGPLGTSLLQRHGLRWPANAICHVPLFELAGDGTLLTGLDGDKLLGGWRWRQLADLRTRRAPVTGRRLVTAGHAVLPRPLQRLVTGPRNPVDVPWLDGRTRRRAHRRLTAQLVAEPTRWDRWVGWLADRRYLRVAIATLEALAAPSGTRVRHPLLDHGFLAALAHEGGRDGYGSRADAMAALVGDLLPGRLVRRRTKAVFNRAFVGPATRAFAAAPEVEVVRELGIDLDAYRSACEQDVVDFRAVAALQYAWLAAAGRGTSRSRTAARGR